MECSDLHKPNYRVLTFRDEQEVIAEDIETEMAARTRFASAIDLCKSRGDDHRHRVELWSGGQALDKWEQSR